MRSAPCFRLAAGSVIALLLGVFGPWQKTLFGISANGLEVAPLLLVPALLLAGYAVYAYDRGREEQRRSIASRLIIAAALVGLAELVTTDQIGGVVLPGWGLTVAGVGGAGLFVAGIWVLRSDSLTGQ